MQKQLSHILATSASGSGALEHDRLPIFPRPIEQCTTADSSPYLCTIGTFLYRYGTNPHRRALVAELATLASKSAEIGVSIRALLIGGSFVDVSIEHPRDIDCLVFYVVEAAAESIDDRISTWVRFLRDLPIDVKLCPIDAGPLTIIKRAIFFSNLFSINRSSLALERGTILLEIASPDDAAPTSDARAIGKDRL